MAIRILVASFVILGFFVLYSEDATADIYKWVDEEGNVHYSDNPPQNAETERVQLPSTPDPKGDPSGHYGVGSSRPRKPQNADLKRDKQRQLRRKARGQHKWLETNVVSNQESSLYRYNNDYRSIVTRKEHFGPVRFTTPTRVSVSTSTTRLVHWKSIVYATTSRRTASILTTQRSGFSHIGNERCQCVARLHVRD